METFQSLFNAMTDNDVNRLIELASEFALIILLVELIGLALYVPLLVLIWFAPALVILENQKVPWLR